MKPRLVAALGVATLALSLSAAACSQAQPSTPAVAPSSSPTSSASTGVGMPMPSATATFIESASPVGVPGTDVPAPSRTPAGGVPHGKVQIIKAKKPPKRHREKPNAAPPAGPPAGTHASLVATAPSRQAPANAEVYDVPLKVDRRTPAAENKPLAPTSAQYSITQGANPNTWCDYPGANIWEKSRYSGFQQVTYYCWSKSGYGVFSLGYGDLRGWSVNPVVTWMYPLDVSRIQCYPYTYPNGFTIARGNCVQSSMGHFHAYASGGYGIDILGSGANAQVTVDKNLNVWTQVRVWFNGYAECANSHDPRWTSCWSSYDPNRK